MFEVNNCHSMTAEEALTALGSSMEGLSPEEAEARLAQYGPNQIQERAETTWVETLLAQVKNPLVYILIIAAAVSYAFGHITDGSVILAVVLINTVIGFVQEYRAERAMAELAKLAAPKAVTRRGGADREIVAAEVVPGDVLILTAGNRVPADARVLTSIGIEADESPLTGESQPVPKSPHKVPEDATVPDRTDMVYAGTVITRGRGDAAVCATGKDTQFGGIAEQVLTQHRVQTPLQAELAVLGRNLGLIALGLAALVFVAGVLRGLTLFEMFLFAVASAVAAIPEGLPAVVTIALAIGLTTMARRSAIIRRLPAVESLGSATVIVSDKTGTLTQNKMTVRAVYLPGLPEPVRDAQLSSDERVLPILAAAAIANDSELKETDGLFQAAGDPTEAALVVAAARAGIRKNDLDTQCARAAEIPFESERGYMATLNRCPDGAYIYIKGAPEVILGMAALVRVDGEDAPLTDERQQEMKHANASLADRALRVLAVARKQVDDAKSDLVEEDLREGLVHLGLIGMMDPPRPEAIGAVAKCRSAGIRVIMATGDNRNTARAIARDFGMLTEDSLVVDGSELARMTDEELAQRIDHISVYARVEPQHKLRVVNTLKARGEVVAVTGDGVNDAPALKRADIGVAMGLTGTGVAREAGDMVLADDNFATIVAAVEEGRTVFERIRKVVAYLIATNAGEMLTIAVAVAAGLPLPLTAVQLLWVNLVTDSGPSLALATDPPDEDVLARPPRDPRHGVISREVLLRLAIVSPTMAAASLAALFIGAEEDLIVGRTMVFVTLAISQLFNAVNIRSASRSAFAMSPFSNRWLIVAIIAAILLQILPVHVPILQEGFTTTSLGPAQWAICFGLASLVLWTEEVRKLVKGRL